MKLSSLLLAIVFCLMVAMGAYIFFINDLILGNTNLLIFGGLVISFVVIFVLQAEIDWAWWQRNPPQMHPALEHQMAIVLPYYRQLDTMEKRRFRDRVMLWVNGKEHLVKALNGFPEEVKNMIGAHGVMLTFGVDKYLMQPYERVVMYPHPFPSPDHPYLHNSEHFDENGKDGGFIFNATQLMHGINKPQHAYNIVLHEMAGAFMQVYPNHAFPHFTEEKISLLHQVRGMDLELIQKTIGTKEVEVKQVAVEHFFTNPVRFNELLPEEFVILCRIFNQNPLNTKRPVLDIQKIGDNPLKGI